MNKSDLLTGFNNHLIDFFKDVAIIFPKDNDIQVAHASLIAIRKVNPKLIITIWKTYIADKYKNEIEKGDLNFFADKNYYDDLNDTDNAATILEKIDTLREPIKLMGDKNRQITIKYMQNLTKLCLLYH